MKLLSILFLFFICYPCNIYSNWQRSVTNYSRHTYQSGNQNWMISQHNNGWMYFANNKGLLEFDGVNWQTYSIHNAKVRAVKAAPDGKIYVGGIDQFGYFIPNRLGGLNYICTSDSLKKKRIKVGAIWNIHIAEDRVFYQSNDGVFYTEKGKITEIVHPKNISFSAIINNKFYITTSEGLLVLDGNKFSLLPNTEILQNMKVIGLLPLPHSKILIVTNLNGLYIYDRNTLSRFNSIADDFIKRNQLFCATINNSLLALGSVQDGVLLYNFSKNEIEHITITNGLQNKTVLSVFIDKGNNLWLGLDNGIDCIHLDSPLYSLYGNKSIIGSGYSSFLCNNMLYLGTNQGLYHTENPLNQNKNAAVEFIPGTEGQVWSMTSFNNELFCSGDNGVFVVKGTQISRVENIKSAWSVASLNAKENLMVAGTYTGLALIKKEGEIWVCKNRIKGFNSSCKGLLVDDISNIVWISNKENGLFRIKISNNYTKIDKIKNYNNKSFPVGSNVHLSKINNEIVFSSPTGIYKYNQIKDRLEEYTSLELNLDGKNHYTYLHQDKFGNIWYVVNGILKIARYNSQTNRYERKLNESYLRGYMIEDFEDVYVNGNQAIIGTEEGFSLLKLDHTLHKNNRLTLEIRHVYVTTPKDSLIYGRSFQNNPVNVLVRYRNNSIRIEYSLNNYDKSSSTLYSHKLSGAKEEGWSEYSETTSKEYTHLKEGKYTFSVRAITDKNFTPIYTSFEFEVLPPWYRTFWAFLFYGCLFILLTYNIYNRISKSKKRLIEQKEKELLMQELKFKKQNELKDRKIDSLEEEKLRSELKFKTEELTRSTLNILRKNEILLEIKKEALSISHSIQEENLVNIRRKTLRLINRVDTNIEHDNDFQVFQDNFDSIHEDFFTRLEEIAPDLNKKEKMLCAYIQMNLLSKEIAPLLNISLRGVEISRYRLRKKLNLSKEENLVSFLQRLSKNA